MTNTHPWQLLSKRVFPEAANLAASLGSSSSALAAIDSSESPHRWQHQTLSSQLCSLDFLDTSTWSLRSEAHASFNQVEDLVEFFPAIFRRKLQRQLRNFRSRHPIHAPFFDVEVRPRTHRHRPPRTLKICGHMDDASCNQDLIV